MRWLLFLSRLAFICGVFFIVAVSLLISDWVNDPDLESTIITIGFTMGLIIMPVTILCYIGVLLVKRKLKPYVPIWLVIANVLFLLLLIAFIIYMNDTHYRQK